MRERLRSERQQQRDREINAGWGDGGDVAPQFVPHRTEGSGRHYLTSPAAQQQQPGRRTPSKADRVLGRDPNLYADGTQDVAMQRLSSRGRTLEDELNDTDEEDVADGGYHEDGRGAQAPRAVSRDEAERRAIEVVTNGGGWGRGASGMLRASSHTSSNGGTHRSVSPRFQDDGVD